LWACNKSPGHPLASAKTHINFCYMEAEQVKVQR
jgi:hypothetical protein